MNADEADQLLLLLLFYTVASQKSIGTMLNRAVPMTVRGMSCSEKNVLADGAETGHSSHESATALSYFLVALIACLCICDMPDIPSCMRASL